LRPERDDIGAPILPGRITWLNAEEPPVLAALTATGPALVHFFDVTQLNSVRTLPYIVAWERRYREHGLNVLGIHSPRFRFSGDPEVVGAGLTAHGVQHPVAIDSDYAIWHDYGVKGWPSLFVWGRGGALAWAHFGEGEYGATEEAIQEALRAEDVTLSLPDPMAPLRPTDAHGALVRAPSPEVFPGGSPAQAWTADTEGDRLALDYEAASAWVVAEGDGNLRAAVDDGPPVDVSLEPPGLVEVARHQGHERHRIELTASGDVRLWAVSFEPGIA
jgi:hypothetical protein